MQFNEHEIFEITKTCADVCDKWFEPLTITLLIETQNAWLCVKKGEKLHKLQCSVNWAARMKHYLENLKVPIKPQFVYGYDGEITKLRFGEGACKAELCWWSIPPKGWEILDEFVKGVIGMVDSLIERAEGQEVSPCTIDFIRVAGTRYSDKCPNVDYKVGTPVGFRRDYGNEYDEFATEICLYPEGDPIGYVPREISKEFSELVEDPSQMIMGNVAMMEEGKVFIHVTRTEGVENNG